MQFAEIQRVILRAAATLGSEVMDLTALVSIIVTLIWNFEYELGFCKRSYFEHQEIDVSTTSVYMSIP